MQNQRALALKTGQGQGEKGLKERVTFHLCCHADGSKRFRPLNISKFEKPHCTSK
jgi:DDE superfamily endonuclease.